MSGTGSFTQSGGTNTAGSLMLGQNAGSLGIYNLNAGLLRLSGLTQGAGNAAFNSSGGTFQAGLTFSTSVPIVLSAAGTNTVFDTNGMTVTLSSPLSGAGGLQKVGSGTMTLAASDSYLGLTLINAGTLSLANSAALAGNGNITFGGGMLQFTASNTLDYASRIVNSSGPIQLDTNGQNVIVASSLTSSNSAGLTKLGAGTLTLSAVDGYTGLTSINAGTLSLAHSAALAGNGNITFGGGTLQFTANNAIDYANRIISSSGPIQVDTNGQDVTFAGSLTSSNSAGLTKAGLGTLTLSAANGYTGTTLVSGGTLLLANTAALSGSTLDTSGSGSLSFGTLTSADFGGLQGSGNLTLNNTSPGGRFPKRGRQ